VREELPPEGGEGRKEQKKREKGRKGERVERHSSLFHNDRPMNDYPTFNGRTTDTEHREHISCPHMDHNEVVNDVVHHC